MLARHLTSEWDLAMIDLNVYCGPDDGDALVVMPELLGTVQAELRQVVRVVVEGASPKARVVVDKIVNDEERPSRGVAPASVEDFLSLVREQVPAQTDVARRIIQAMQQMAAGSENVTFGLRTGSANLYWTSATGPRRFLSLRSDGRLRLVLRYLLDAGLDDLVDRLVVAARPAFRIERTDHAGGLRYVPANEQGIVEFLGRVEGALLDKPGS